MTSGSFSSSFDISYCSLPVKGPFSMLFFLALLLNTFLSLPLLNSPSYATSAT